MRQPQAVLVGLLAAGITTGLVEGLGHLLAPPPFPVDMSTPEAMGDLLAAASPLALMFVPLAWTAGSGAGAWLSVRLSNKRPHRPGWITAALFGLITVYQMFAIPHPWWLRLAGLAGIVAGGYLGTRHAAGQTEGP